MDLDLYELLDSWPALRWVLWVWNGLCLVAAGLCIVAAVALLVSAAGGGGEIGDAIGDAIAGELAGFAFLGLFLVGFVWWLGRAVLVRAGRWGRR